VNIGTSYLNHSAGKVFCHYIAEATQEKLIENFFSILMDGSTDKGNIDDELFLVLLIVVMRKSILP
jgi:hypothetical protein